MVTPHYIYFPLDTSVRARGTSFTIGLVLPPYTYRRLFRVCRLTPATRWSNVPKGHGISGAYPFLGLRLKMAFPASQSVF